MEIFKYLDKDNTIIRFMWIICTVQN